MGGRGCFPGSFNPLTVAHLAIAEAAVHICDLASIDLIVSRVALTKEMVDRPRLDDRVAVLRDAAVSRPWLGVVVTEDQLLVDHARGYDILVLGADKWAQVLDPVFYGGSVAARDVAVARLPLLALVPRPGSGVAPPEGAVLLSLPFDLAPVSSTAARTGAREWMAPEAREFDDQSGAWTDPERYERWLRAAGDP